MHYLEKHDTKNKQFLVQELLIYSALRNSGQLKEHALISPPHRSIDNQELESCILNINEIKS